MTIRSIPPLDEETWNEVVSELEKEPDPKRVAFLKEAMEFAQKMKTCRD